MEIVKDNRKQVNEQEEGLTVEQFLTKIKLMGMDDIFNRTAESVVRMAASYMELLNNNHFLLDQLMLATAVKHLEEKAMNKISFSTDELEKCMEKYGDRIMMEVNNNKITFKIEGEKINVTN